VPYQVFHTQDKDVIISVGSDKQWMQFCDVIGLGAAVRDDPRFANNPARLQHRAELIPLIETALAHRPAAPLLDALRAAEIPCGPINTVPDLLSDAHYRERGNVVGQGERRSLANPVRLSETPPAYRLPPPALGEHTDEVLAMLGYAPETIAAMRDEGVI
jgi:crotonobetainyl-CoA:carnitine CoA-transferase CaiB-like acyl-CoA transferase